MIFSRICYPSEPAGGLQPQVVATARSAGFSCSYSTHLPVRWLKRWRVAVSATGTSEFGEALGVFVALRRTNVSASGTGALRKQARDTSCVVRAGVQPASECKCSEHPIRRTRPGALRLKRHECRAPNRQLVDAPVQEWPSVRA